MLVLPPTPFLVAGEPTGIHERTVVAGIGPASTGRRGGEIRLRMEWPVSFNPLVHSSHDISRLVHAGLVEIDPISHQFELAVAKTIALDKERKQLTVSLRKGLRFSDGTPVTAKDVLFTFNDLILNEKNDLEPRTWIVVGRGRYVINRLERMDENTVRFYLNVPMPSAFMSWLSEMPILPSHKLAQIPPENSRQFWDLREKPENIVGLGPFAFKSISPDRIVLTRNTYYWKQDRTGMQLPYVERVVLDKDIRFRFNSTKRLEIEPMDDIIQWPQSFGPDIASAWRQFADFQGYTLKIGGPSAFTTVLVFNQDVPQESLRNLFRDVRFRRAVAHAIKKDELVASFPFGGVPRTSTVNFHSPAQKDNLLPRYPYDPGLSKQMLASIGFAERPNDGLLYREDGTTIRFSLLIDSGNSVQRAFGRLLVHYLRSVGMDVTLEESPFDTLFARVYQTDVPKFEAALQTYRDDQLFPALHLSVVFFHLDEPTHVYRRSDAKIPINELPLAQQRLLRLAELYREVSNDDRWLTIQTDMQRVAAEDLSVIPLAAGNHAYLSRRGLENASNIEGWSPSLFIQLTHMWWREGE